MFDIAGTELLLIVIIAVVVVGPKDLPKMMRSMGRWARKIQSASAEFRRQIDQLAREAELEEIVAEANAAGRKIHPGKMIQEALDPEHELDGPVMSAPISKDTPKVKKAADSKTDKKKPAGDDEGDK